MEFKGAALAKMLSDYPDEMSLEQVRKACHISKRKAAALVEQGTLEGYKTGAATSVYKVRKESVKKYLASLDAEGEATLTHGTPKIASAQFIIPQNRLPRVLNKYKDLTANWPDLMSTDEVSEKLGYKVITVRTWINDGHLKSIRLYGQNHIPKECLLRFMVSERFRMIAAKSEKHVALEKKVQASTKRNYQERG